METGDGEEAKEIFPQRREGREERNAPLQARQSEERPGGKGGKVKSRKQAIAIGLSKARKKARRSRESAGKAAPIGPFIVHGSVP